MTPDDTRHGTHAGYVAGCRNECCLLARRRARKQRDLYRHRSGTGCRIPHDTFRTAVEPWLLLGLSPYALEEATGVGSRIADILRDRSDVLRTTYRAVKAMTEDDIPDAAKVYTHLTRTRIDSLMAAGHRLVDMPINARGQWRSREFIAVDTARKIRDYYAAHEFEIGPDRHTAARALNRGARLPLAWDDPGTLAWPGGRPPRMVGHLRTPSSVVDPIVVERLLAGERLPATKAERDAAMRRWKASGRSERSLCVLQGWKDSRYGRDEDAA